MVKPRLSVSVGHGFKINYQSIVPLYANASCFTFSCLQGSPWSIFVNSYTMREEYKSHGKRKQLSDQYVLCKLSDFVLGL